MRTRRYHTGLIFAEVVTSIVLLGLLLVVVNQFVLAYNRAADHSLTRHQAQLACETYLEHLRAGAAPPEDTDSLQYEVQRTPGEGDWTGLTRISVTASVKSPQARADHRVHYTLTTYLPESPP